jgi:hypothetical protein
LHCAGVAAGLDGLHPAGEGLGQRVLPDGPGFDGWAKLVIDADTDTLLGATFVGPEFAELVQAATLAVVAKVPVDLLRHVVAPHPSVNQIWNPLLARER